GVALATATTAELEVDPAGFVALGADDVQAAELFDFEALGLHVFALLDIGHQLMPFFLRYIEARRVLILQLRPGPGFSVAGEDDVGTAAGHVRGDGDWTFAPSLSNDLGFTFVVLGIQHLMLDTALVEETGEPFALFDRDRTHEYRASATLAVFDFVRGNRARIF